MISFRALASQPALRMRYGYLSARTAPVASGMTARCHAAIPDSPKSCSGKRACLLHASSRPPLHADRGHPSFFVVALSPQRSVPPPLNRLGRKYRLAIILGQGMSFAKPPCQTNAPRKPRGTGRSLTSTSIPPVTSQSPFLTGNERPREGCAIGP
jgi:hypothetical protein